MGGANAIYLGLSNFNARMKAQNFGGENLRDIVRRAHFFGAKVYVTLNTILQNSEFNDMISLVKEAICAKVDAFLVQDIGVAALLRDAFEGITLHASTQMGIHNLEGAKAAERMGIKRVVLSRETTLEDIRAIRQGTSLELEYFVQGALCVAFSGECYLSSVEQGASGNRGLCKQLCRLPYEAELRGAVRTGHMLSARDLCLANSVKKLLAAGVTAFKIEGRMRRAGYVAKAVSVYRKIIYGAQAELTDEDRFSLKTAFSRGEYLERAYLDGGTPSVVEPRYNSHTGVEIGEVLTVKPFKKELEEVTVRSNFDIKDGDGLKLFDGDAEMASLGAGGVQKLGGNRYRFVTSAKAKAGYRVRLTLDSAAEEAILSCRRYVPIVMSVTALKGKPLTLSAECDMRDGRGEFARVREEVCSEFVPSAAKNAPMDEDMLREQATKTLYSGFAASSCAVETDGVFVPKSVINAARRELLEKLADRVVATFEGDVEIKTNFEPSECLNLQGGVPIEPSARLRYIFPEDGGSAFLRKRDIPVIAPSAYTAEEVTKTIAELELEPSEVALKLPPLASGRDIAAIDALLDEVPIRTLVAESIYGMEYAARGYRVIAGEGLNIANDFAAREAIRLGAYAVTPSLEFKQGVTTAANLGYGCGKRDIPAPIRVFASDYRYPLMTLAHCPYKTQFANDCAHCSYAPGLTLRRGRREYAVRRIRMARCVFELYDDSER